MANYINKDELLNLLKQLEFNLMNDLPYYNLFVKGFSECVGHVANYPITDVVEVKHGKWIDLGRNYYTFVNQCSECGAKYDFRSPYCPNCGAKMEDIDND